MLEAKQAWNICHLFAYVKYGRLSTEYKMSRAYQEASCTNEAVLVVEGSDDIHQAIIINTPGKVVVAFRGTDRGSKLDWMNDTRTNMVPFLEGEGRLHQGFYDATTRLARPLIAELCPIICNFPKKEILITGHSKGGALAVIFARMLITAMQNFNPLKKEPVINIITFGSPKIGDDEFKRDINFHLNVVRYEAKWDIVPKFPYTGADGDRFKTSVKSRIDVMKRNKNRYVHVGQLKMVDWAVTIQIIEKELDEKWNLESLTRIQLAFLLVRKLAQIKDGHTYWLKIHTNAYDAV